MADPDYFELDEQWDAIAATLGQVVIEWSKIEGLLALVFLSVADAPAQLATLVLKKSSVESQIDYVKKLSGRFPTPDQEKIRSWTASVNTLREKRNKLFHSHLVNQSSEDRWHPSLLTFTYDAQHDQVKPQTTRITTAELEVLLDEAYDVIRAFKDLPAWARTAASLEVD